jgi:hypothetical protein
LKHTITSTPAKHKIAALLCSKARPMYSCDSGSTWCLRKCESRPQALRVFTQALEGSKGSPSHSSWYSSWYVLGIAVGGSNSDSFRFALEIGQRTSTLEPQAGVGMIIRINICSVCRFVGLFLTKIITRRIYEDTVKLNLKNIGRKCVNKIHLELLNTVLNFRITWNVANFFIVSQTFCFPKKSDVLYS